MKDGERRKVTTLVKLWEKKRQYTVQFSNSILIAEFTDYMHENCTWNSMFILMSPADTLATDYVPAVPFDLSF